ncbi:MAG: hypothetical protein ACI81L_000920 [Verrucomicrobiales bacterium]|jgi:hypothetical protein
MMYSWRERRDTTVLDEPLYAYYLATSGRAHPGADDVLASQDNDGASVIENVMMADYDTPVVFFKQIAKHIVDLDLSFLPNFTNVLLTREPHDMLSSWQVQMPDSTIADTGYPELLQILDIVLAAGQEPIVIETNRLLSDPAGVLRAVCDRVGIDFDDAMLSWPSGPKPEDGVWAPYWYDGVWGSMGWKPNVPKNVELLPGLAAALPEAEAAYERLLPYRL